MRNSRRRIAESRVLGSRSPLRPRTALGAAVRLWQCAFVACALGHTHGSLHEAARGSAPGAREKLHHRRRLGGDHDRKRKQAQRGWPARATDLEHAVLVHGDGGRGAELGGGGGGGAQEPRASCERRHSGRGFRRVAGRLEWKIVQRGRSGSLRVRVGWRRLDSRPTAPVRHYAQGPGFSER